jgi:hypothetical protein
MKKYILIFILFSAAAILYLSFPVTSKEHFISIKDNKFRLNGKGFYPVAINYIVSARADKNEIWTCPYFGYTPDLKNPSAAKDSCLLQLKADMELIKEMGFNSIRLIGAAFEPDINKQTNELSIIARLPNTQDTAMALSNEESYKKYLNSLHELFDIVNKSGLKIILLTRVFPEVPSTEIHLQKVVTEFKNDTSILAYDLFNEPLYFDSPARDKSDVYPIVKKWHKIVKMYAPHQLCTIGLEGIREIFEWDPNLLDVDFISLHPYEVEPDQVRNEIYWYGHYITKPWIIGETAIPADNDSVTYETQKKWAEKTLKQAYDCGASGYSWWQYKDVDWHQYHANFLGVVNRKGETTTAKTKLVVQGTVKPLAEAFKNFNPAGKKDSCLCLSNYYNYSQHNKFRMTGYLVDENNDPIKGGIFLAWNQDWSHSYHTVSKENGSFELLSDFPFYHWIASATMRTMTRGELLPDTARIFKDNIPTINIGTLKLHKLSIKE